MARQIALAGAFGGKAVLVVDGGRPQTVAVGSATREGVRLMAMEGDVAVIEYEGRSWRIRLGEDVVSMTTAAGDGVRLRADSRGQFVSDGRINDVAARMLIDTGASVVSIGRSDARRLGVDYSGGLPGMSATANGPVRVWRIKLDSVEVGGVKVHNVDAAVHDSDFPFVLLGMSFLGRMDWQRDGDSLVLKRRY